MKRVAKHFIVDHGTYPFDVLVCFDMSDDEVEEALNKLGHEINEEEKEVIKCIGEGRTVMLETGQTVLRVNTTKEKFHARLAHEVFHAVEFLFEKINLPHDIQHGEAYAYQIDYLTEQIYRAIKHNVKRI